LRRETAAILATLSLPGRVMEGKTAEVDG
jgi:hypothetical protein